MWYLTLATVEKVYFTNSYYVVGKAWKQQPTVIILWEQVHWRNGNHCPFPKHGAVWKIWTCVFCKLCNVVPLLQLDPILVLLHQPLPLVFGMAQLCCARSHTVLQGGGVGGEGTVFSIPLGIRGTLMKHRSRSTARRNAKDKGTIVLHYALPVGLP